MADAPAADAAPKGGGINLFKAFKTTVTVGACVLGIGTLFGGAALGTGLVFANDATMYALSETATNIGLG